MSGSISVLAVYIASLFGLDVPATVGSALTTIRTAIVIAIGGRKK